MDTNLMELRLPQEKINQLKQELQDWRNKHRCRKRELLSLIGKLSHACKVVVAGRLFLRRMIDTASSARRINHWVHLNSEFRADLLWWTTFLQYWNGRSFMDIHDTDWKTDVSIFTDASGSWGCGASWDNRWIQCAWNTAWRDENIAVKELLPIVLAVAIWGQEWCHKRLLIRCDNMAVVQVINAQNCRDHSLLHLLRCLHFYTALYDIRLKALHIEGSQNVIADAISRGHMQVLFQHKPEADVQPTPIPMEVWSFLLNQKPQWMSDHWRRLLHNSLKTAWHQAQEEPIRQPKHDS